MMKWLKNKLCARRAKKAGVPAHYEKFWPPYYVAYKGSGPEGMSLIQEPLYEARTGDVVPIWSDGAVQHTYKIINRWRAGGNDHVVSPLQFELDYQGSITLSNTKD